MIKKGDFTGILYMIVILAAFAIFLLIVGKVVPEINQQLANQIGISQEVNSSLSISTNVAQKTLPVVWFMVMTILFLGLLITAWFINSHPIFIPVFAILLILIVMVSIPLSNAYQELAGHSEFTSQANEQTAIGFIMEYLPVFAFILGIIIFIISFAKPGGSSEIPV